MIAVVNIKHPSEKKIVKHAVQLLSSLFVKIKEGYAWGTTAQEKSKDIGMTTDIYCHTNEKSGYEMEYHDGWDCKLLKVLRMHGLL